ncbi:MAG: hypothetical protein K2X53_02695, partial [Alphaproteobacteria bacterium]|nr:hypothetical protein [Alphaproteobacteria bacterium]
MNQFIPFFMFKIMGPALLAGASVYAFLFGLHTFFSETNQEFVITVVSFIAVVLTFGIVLYRTQPKERARKYHRIMDSFGDPHRIYLITDKKYTVHFASPAFYKIFPKI